MPNIKPKSDKVFVKPLPRDDKSAGGVLIPDIAQKLPYRAEIISIGPEVTLASVGDTVIYNRWAGEPFTIDNVDYLIFEEEHIFAKETV